MFSDSNDYRITENDIDAQPLVKAGNVYYKTTTFASMLSTVIYATCLLESKSDASFLLGDDIILALLAASSFAMFIASSFTWNAANHPSKSLSHSRINEAKFAFAFAALGLFAAVAYACVEGDPNDWKEFIGFSGIYTTVGALGCVAAHSAYRLHQDNKPTA